MSENTGSKMFFSFLTGAAIGAGLALLFAPQSGKETRKQIKDFSGKISGEIKDEVEKKKLPWLPFWPNFILRETIIWLLLLGILLTISVLFAPSLDLSADLMAPAPEGVKPEWYFLFLFQTLKIFPANMGPVTGEFVAVVLILIVVVAIFFMPFLEGDPRGKRGKLVAYGGILGIIYALVMSIWSLL